MNSDFAVNDFENALNVILKFKGSSLYDTIALLEEQAKGKKQHEIHPLRKEYAAALKIKEISAQINEVIHATGIVNSLKKIMEGDEEIVSLSLASAARGAGIDLVTTKRIAEFKFSHSIKGIARRNAFSDLVSLYLRGLESKVKLKELYVFNAPTVVKVLSSKDSDWRSVLSKHGALKDRLAKRLETVSPTATTLHDIFHIAGVNVIDINNVIE